MKEPDFYREFKSVLNMNVKDDILQTIGMTPMVRINRLSPNPDVNIFAKLEGFNPTGSIKDRIALKMIEEAERSGRLRPGQTIIEATSGNTGIGLAIIGIVRGYPVEIVMSSAVSIERRLAAMKAFHDAGVRTTCFISPIFPGITVPEEIIMRAREQCNLIWLENLNLRGGYRKTIMEYIAARHPELMPLYDAIYVRKDRSYWHELDMRLREFAGKEGLPYLRDDDSVKRPFSAPPAIVNYFFHEEIIPSAKKRNAPAGDGHP